MKAGGNRSLGAKERFPPAPPSKKAIKENNLSFSSNRIKF